MTFTVVWSLRALQALTALKKSAADPAPIRAAEDRVDWVLRRLPLDVGESRHRNFRVWYGDVLGVYYRVDEAAMRVEVLYAGPARR